MSSGQRTSNSGVEEISCDLCILGAGIAGLNALFVASRYLSPSSRVVLVDRRAGVGGMWLSTYDYVGLHQPHPLFTAGNIPWTFGKERSHLATGAEVLSHHCVRPQHIRRPKDNLRWSYRAAGSRLHILVAVY
jgi:cation diffusion facilitator CzcD-associated flavoprotein CzcO